jgi:hypothetical protein
MLVVLRLRLFAREGGYFVQDKGFCLVDAVKSDEAADCHGGFRGASGENADHAVKNAGREYAA